MNREYLKWLRAIKSDSICLLYEEWFWDWLRTGTFKRMFKEGLTPELAAFSLVPW